MDGGKSKPDVLQGLRDLKKEEGRPLGSSLGTEVGAADPSGDAKQRQAGKDYTPQALGQ